MTPVRSIVGNRIKFGKNAQCDLLLSLVFGLAFAFGAANPIAALGAAPQSADQTGRCEPHQLANLTLEIADNGSILVPVEFDKTPAFMYLEIGSPFSLLSQQAAVQFHLAQQEIGKALEVTSGTRRVQTYTDSDFTLGDLVYRQAHFFIDPNSEAFDRYSRPELIGILGIDLLWKMDFELDLAHRRLRFYEHSHCWHQTFADSANYHVVPLRRDAFGNMFFPMELDGRKLETLLATGSRMTTLSTDVTRRVYGFDRNSSGIETTTTEDGHTIAQYRAMKLTASGLTLIDERVLLTDPWDEHCHLARKGDAIGYTGCLYNYPLRLGSDVLERMHVFFATGDNEMFYMSNAEAARP
jgi:hypothetical protein